MSSTKKHYSSIASSLRPAEFLVDLRGQEELVSGGRVALRRYPEYAPTVSFMGRTTHLILQYYEVI